MEAVVVSACLCGEPCRWHGRATAKSRAVRLLELRGCTIVPICPEMLGGLPCPRPPVRTITGRAYETDPETRHRIGPERTAEFRAGAAKAVRIARRHGATFAYLFKLSPSCAENGIAGRAFREAGITVIPTW